MLVLLFSAVSDPINAKLVESLEVLTSKKKESSKKRSRYTAVLAVNRDNKVGGDWALVRPVPSCI